MASKATLTGAKQTYPKWMQPKDIYESMCLGTNVMFAEAFKVRDAMIEAFPDNNTVPMWLGIDKEIVNSINNNLWIPNMGYYSEYLYGGVYPVQSQAVDNLGQALAINIRRCKSGDGALNHQQDSLHPLRHIVVYPQQPTSKPYHNERRVAFSFRLLEHCGSQGPEHGGGGKRSCGYIPCGGIVQHQQGAFRCP